MQAQDEPRSGDGPADDTRIYLIEDDRTILQFVEESLRRRPQWKLVGHSDTFAHAQVMAPLSLADVAAELGMSESRFSRFFRRATGNSFTDFVSRVRINSACHLLMQTDCFIADICFQVGFSNLANFNRRFLEIKGMTPSEFRRQAESRFGAG